MESTQHLTFKPYCGSHRVARSADGERTYFAVNTARGWRLTVVTLGGPRESRTEHLATVPTQAAAEAIAIEREHPERPVCCDHSRDDHSYMWYPDADVEVDPAECEFPGCPCLGWGVVSERDEPADIDYQAVRPTRGRRVKVTFPGNDWHDPETIDGTVTDRDDDSLEITPDGATIGETFTLYDRELADGRATLEVL